MKRLSFSFQIFAFLSLFLCPVRSQSAILEEFPSLKPLLYEEPQSRVMFGFGLSPFEILKNKPGFTLHLLQVHYLSRWIDWEALGFDFGMSLSTESQSNIKHFSVRTVPKFRINSTFSIGPLLGYEYVIFPEVDALIKKRIWGQDFHTEYEPFSSRGWIYGLSFVQNFPFRKKYIIRSAQSAYFQNYSATHTSEGWEYMFKDATSLTDEDALKKFKEKIEPGYVIAVEFSFLY